MTGSLGRRSVALLVVPLAADETGVLTLDEWDALNGCERVMFERPDHPLIERLQAAGVPAAAFDDEPAAQSDGWALVAEPDSRRILELARAGAVVSAGAASPPDPVTAAHAARVVRRAAASLGTLAAVMARLRSEDGCPWDRDQSHGSLTVHLLEEAHEVIDAVESDRLEAELQEELGDVLLQVAFHARLAEQEGRFDLAEVADGIVAKLVHRHPHVFGDVEVADAAEVLRNWETIKSSEKDRSDPFEDIPSALPALLAASKTQKRAARLGFSAGEDEARARLGEALASDDGVGRALFWLVAVARARGTDPEAALRRATRAFRDRVAARPPLRRA
ncbi:MAG: YabN family protein [Actinomycetota bacterium]